MIVTGLRMAPGSYVAALVSAEQVAGKEAEDCKEYAQSQTSGIDYHRRLFQFMLLMIVASAHGHQARKPPRAKTPLERRLSAAKPGWSRALGHPSSKAL